MSYLNPQIPQGPNSQMLKSKQYALFSKANPLEKKVQQHLDDFQMDRFSKDEFFSKYNKQFLKQYDEALSRNQHLSLYQKELLKYSDEVDKGAVISIPEQINPVIGVLQEENTELRAEIDTLQKDLQQFVQYTEQLLVENKAIHEHINQKNRDLEKMLETIGLNDGEEIKDLNHKIHILTEENNILIKHLNEMKKLRDDYENFVSINKQEIVKAKETHDQMQSQLDKQMEREKLLVKQLEQLKPNFTKAKKDWSELQEKYQEISKQLEISNIELEKSKQEVQYQKQNLEEQLQKKQLDNDQLLQENNLYSQEKKELKQELAQNNEIINQLSIENKKMRQDIELQKSEMDELSTGLQEFKNQIAIEKSRADSSIQREREMQIKMENAIHEADKAQIKVQQLEKQYNILLNQSKADSQEKHAKYEKLIENLKMQQKKLIDEKEEQNLSFTKTINDQKRVIDKNNQDIELKTKENNDLKNKLQDYLYQKRIIDQQTLELNRTKSELQDMNNVLNEYKNQIQANPQQKVEYENLQKKVYELEEQIRDYELQLQEKNADRDQTQLQLQYQEVVNERDQLQQQVDALKSDNQKLKGEIDKIIHQNLDYRISKSPENYQMVLQERDNLLKEKGQLLQRLQQVEAKPLTHLQPITSEPVNIRVLSPIKEAQIQTAQPTQIVTYPQQSPIDPGANSKRIFLSTQQMPYQTRTVLSPGQVVYPEMKNSLMQGSQVYKTSQGLTQQAQQLESATLNQQTKAKTPNYNYRDWLSGNQASDSQRQGNQ